MRDRRATLHDHATRMREATSCIRIQHGSCSAQRNALIADNGLRAWGTTICRGNAEQLVALQIVFAVRNWLAPPENPSRIAHHHGERGHIGGDDGTCANEGALADLDSAKEHRTGPDRSTTTDTRRFQRPAPRAHPITLFVRGPRISIIGEDDAWSDEDFVFNRHTAADEREARNLAARTHGRSGTNLHEGCDGRIVTDRAPIEVHESVNYHPISEQDV